MWCFALLAQQRVSMFWFIFNHKSICQNIEVRVSSLKTTRACIVTHVFWMQNPNGNAASLQLQRWKIPNLHCKSLGFPAANLHFTCIVHFNKFGMSLNELFENTWFYFMLCISMTAYCNFDWRPWYSLDCLQMMYSKIWWWSIQLLCPLPCSCSRKSVISQHRDGIF